MREDEEREGHRAREIANYRDLIAWQQGVDLAVECYRLTEAFPTNERYGLASQLQRAAVSIPANVAEGRGRRHLKDFIYHLGVAQGSLCEVETHLEIARRLTYGPSAVLGPLAQRTNELTKVLHGLKNSLLRRLSHSSSTPKA